MTTNRIRYIRNKPKSNLHFFFYVTEKLILSEINQDRYYFSQIIEKRNTFVSCIDHMTYESYIKKPISMGEINLNQTSFRNPNLINYLKRSNCHPIIRKYSNVPFK